MNRFDLRKLATTRLQDAEILFANKRYAGAYYLAGYAVECALKACIARNFKTGDFPDLKTVKNSYTHDLAVLIGVAGLGSALATQSRADPNFAASWAVTKDWSEQSRYELQPFTKARDLLAAVGDQRNGVLPWLTKHW